MCTIIEEEWRDIAGYEGLYQVSNLGRVKSLNYMHTGNEKIRKTKKNKGYLQVSLWKNGKAHHTYVHRLVAETFIPNIKNLPQVNHIDENKENNRVDNLEWCDQKYNLNYGTRIERILEHRTGPHKSKPVLCIETGVVYHSAMEASRQTGASQGNINSCCNGRYGYKTAGGYHWRYAD